MQIPACGSRLISGHLLKAAEQFAGVVLPHVLRQSKLSTSSSSFSGSTLNAACKLARRCCQAEPVLAKLDVQQLRRAACSSHKQAQSSQGRGFAAQAFSKSGAVRSEGFMNQCCRVCCGAPDGSTWGSIVACLFRFNKSACRHKEAVHSGS